MRSRTISKDHLIQRAFWHIWTQRETIMGLLAGLVLTGLLIYWAYRAIRFPDERQKLLAEARVGFQKSPLSSAAFAIWLMSFVAFFCGLLIPPFGLIRVDLGIVVLQLWRLGAVVFFCGTIGGMIIENA